MFQIKLQPLEREREGDITVSLLKAVGQLTKDFSHFCCTWWSFRLISWWLFPQIILARHHLTPGASGLWAFWANAHSHSTGLDVSLYGHCYPRATACHLLLPLCLKLL